MDEGCKMIDAGKYNKNQDEYESLVKDIYQKYENGITLPAEYASFVEEDLGRLLIRLARYKFIAKNIKKTDSVLELGCGSGLGTIYFSQYAKSAFGLDIKSTEIEEARQISKRENASFECGDFFDYKFKEKFDVVVNLDVIEHLDEQLGKKLVAKMSELISDNGIAIIGTPSFYSWPHQGALSRASHVKCYDLPELDSLISKYFARTLCFSMNDEIVHTGHYKMAWYYFIIAFGKKA